MMKKRTLIVRRVIHRILNQKRRGDLDSVNQRAKEGIIVMMRIMLIVMNRMRMSF
jgi:hypothetical protein